jgi:hypothetical protein
VSTVCGWEREVRNFAALCAVNMLLTKPFQ